MSGDRPPEQTEGDRQEHAAAEQAPEREPREKQHQPGVEAHAHIDGNLVDEFPRIPPAILAEVPQTRPKKRSQRRRDQEQRDKL